MNKITVKNIDINVTGIGDDDYINLTDIARIVNPEFPAYVVRNWMRLRATIEFLGICEKLNNNNFILTEFDQIKNEEMSNDFIRHWLRRVDTLNYLHLWKK